MPLVPLADIEDDRLRIFRQVKEGELLRRHGLFVVEGRFAVRTLLERSTMRIRALLATEQAVADLRDVLDVAATPVYVLSRQAIEGVLGFRFHQGCLALGERQVDRSFADVLAASGAGPLLVLEDLASADNVGGMFRTARSLGARGVLLSPSCCDPLYRKAVRGSIGASLVLPHARLGDWPEELDALRAAGWQIVGLTPAATLELSAGCAAVGPADRIALLLGNEGRGLSERALGRCDARWRIEMSPGVDSVNVVIAAGLALYQLRLAQR